MFLMSHVSMTFEKCTLKNMFVFSDNLSKMGNDSEKKEDSGFGFKDKSKALDTIRLLESEPSSYQSLTVRGLLGRAKRTLKRKNFSISI